MDVFGESWVYKDSRLWACEGKIGTRQEEEEALYRIVIPEAFLEHVNDFWVLGLGVKSVSLQWLGAFKSEMMKSNPQTHTDI